MEKLLWVTLHVGPRCFLRCSENGGQFSRFFDQFAEIFACNEFAAMKKLNPVLALVSLFLNCVHF